MEDLVSRFPLKDHRDIDVVVGLTRLTDADKIKDIKDFDTLGVARPFSGYMVLRYPPKSLFKVQQETVMTHELGHLFGAIHTNKPDTVMSPIVRYQIPTALDPENKEILAMTRRMDFRLGLESLPSPDVQRLLGSYLKLMTLDQPFDFYYSLGIFYLKLGQSEDAAKAWEKALAIDPENPRIDYDLGILYSRQGKQAEATERLNAAVRKLSHPSLNEMKADALNYLGNAYLQQKALDAAYRAWSGAAALRKNDPGIQANLATVQLMMGKTDEAIRMYQGVLRIQPKNTKALNNLGYAYYIKGNYAAAITQLQQALKAAPAQTVRGPINALDGSQPSEIHKNLAQVYLKTNDKKKALDHFEASCKLNPAPDCFKSMGIIHYDQGEFEKAVQELSLALSEIKDDAQLYGVLGVALSKLKEDQKAAGVFQEGLKHVKDKKMQAMLHKNLGGIYLQHQQADLAVREYQLAVANDWDSTDGHFGLGLSYYAQDRLLEARQCFANVLRLDPQNAKARELMGKIDLSLSRR